MKDLSSAISSEILTVLNSTDPVKVLKTWLETAKKESHLKEPWAMGLATSRERYSFRQNSPFKKPGEGKLDFFLKLI